MNSATVTPKPFCETHVLGTVRPCSKCATARQNFTLCTSRNSPRTDAATNGNQTTFCETHASGTFEYCQDCAATRKEFERQLTEQLASDDGERRVRIEVERNTPSVLEVKPERDGSTSDFFSGRLFEIVLDDRSVSAVRFFLSQVKDRTVVVEFSGHTSDSTRFTHSEIERVADERSNAEAVNS